MSSTRPTSPRSTPVMCGRSTSLNLTVHHPGEIFGLLGPNSTSKPTTGGMLTTRVVPTKGRAYVGGVDVGKQPARPSS